MKYEKNRKHKFHIKEEDVIGALAEVIGSQGKDTHFLLSFDGAVYDTSLKSRMDTMDFCICLCLSMLILILTSPILLFALPEGHAIDVDRKHAAEVMADSTNYDTSLLVKGSRDNTPLCLVPTADGKEVYENQYAHVDASNTNQGYVIIHYTGESGKVKLRITGPDEITYTYDMATDGGKDEVFPLQAGNGTYLISVFENIEGLQYATVFTQEIEATLDDEFLPFLYPNQYVTFNADNQAIDYAEYLAYSANTDLDVVSNVYNALITSMTYDYHEAETVESGYLPKIDEVLTTGKGICIDYAVLMTAMLRSQKIPTRMEVGYAGTAYHAWLSTYIKDIGWINGMIQFDGKEWSLMDPTFASTTDTKKLANFIGDGENYKTKYIY
ncbi:transglutaminase-like domain-containing protein [Butyrivibrio sp. AE3006]|uniref:transglutaminase-like domain-containing protein n=1 Tax=Butyrivibrio sp. AE3006 TaxID=1280673 RepID=UPI0004294251|nr:transglutaminase-like domain-containing protein [Butyrivibrio sp. AE3006]